MSRFLRAAAPVLAIILVWLLSWTVDHTGSLAIPGHALASLELRVVLDVAATVLAYGFAGACLAGGRKKVRVHATVIVSAWCLTALDCYARSIRATFVDNFLFRATDHLMLPDPPLLLLPVISLSAGLLAVKSSQEEVG